MAESSVRRLARDANGRAFLWVATSHDVHFHFRVWRLNANEESAFEAWERARQSGADAIEEPGLSELTDASPEHIHVLVPEHARRFLARDDDAALDAQVTEFFRALSRGGTSRPAPPAASSVQKASEHR